MLTEEFLEPRDISKNELASSIHIALQTVEEMVDKKRAITPSIALRLAKFFSVSETFWLHLQLRWDLYHAKQCEGKEISQIELFIFSGIETNPLSTRC